MANKENCKYKTVGCQVSSKCEEMKHLKEQIGSLKEQIRIKDLQPRTTFTFDRIKHSDAVDNIKKGIITNKVQNGLQLWFLTLRFLNFHGEKDRIINNYSTSACWIWDGR